MTLAEKLAEAQAAYHKLMTGKAARVVVDQNGERIEYNTANKGALYAYIQELTAQIADPTANLAIRRPMRIWL